MKILQKRRFWSCSNERGFTLMELLIVIMILGLLASIIAVRYSDKPGEARTMKAKMDVGSLENALKLFKLDNAYYPTTEQGLQALVEKPTIGRIPSKWREGGYLEKGKLPKDPWGDDYFYMSPGAHNRTFDIWSYGGDGEEGGEGEDSDVMNWTSQER
jgi:general secretion pathway protein G